MDTITIIAIIIGIITVITVVVVIVIQYKKNTVKNVRKFKMNFFIEELSNNYDLSSDCKKIKCTQKSHTNQERNMAKELVDTVVTFSNRNDGGFDVKTQEGDNFFFQQKNLPTVLGYKDNVWGVTESTDLFIRLYSDETYADELKSVSNIDTTKQYWFVFDDTQNKYYPYLNIDDFSCRMVLVKEGTTDKTASDKKLTIQLNNDTE